VLLEQSVDVVARRGDRLKFEPPVRHDVDGRARPKAAGSSGHRGSFLCVLALASFVPFVV
jgi:hypothetical protein